MGDRNLSPDDVYNLSIMEKMEMLDIDCFRALFSVIDEDVRNGMFESLLKKYYYEDALLMLTDKPFFKENYLKFSKQIIYELNSELTNKYLEDFGITY